MLKRHTSLFLFLLLVSGCASRPDVPYPAFVNTAELSDIFLAELPGVRAKRFFADPDNRTGSYRIDLPISWTGSSGASPGKALELFVLEGELTLGRDMQLTRGSYAYLPPGNLGFNLRSYDGARVLYRILDVNDGAMIQTPLLLDSGLVDWKPAGTPGVWEKTLRYDPGSGDRTWLARFDAGTRLPWSASLSNREGYLLSGSMTLSECVQGVAVTERYGPGGYFYRPADAVHGGPESEVTEDAVWFLREQAALGPASATGCGTR